MYHSITIVRKYLDDMDGEIVKKISKKLENFRENGREVVDVHVQEGEECYYIIILYRIPRIPGTD